MAGFILEKLRKGISFQQAMESEEKEYLEDGPDGKFWVYRQGSWQVVESKRNAIRDIFGFALIIIDHQSDKKKQFLHNCGSDSPHTCPCWECNEKYCPACMDLF